MAATTGQTKKPVNWDELYPGRFIKPGELKDSKPLLIIEEVEMEVLEGSTGPKWTGILSFKNTEKKMTLCKTNGILLRAMFGATLSEWEGRRFNVFKSKWNGDDCIRVWGSPDIEKDMVIKVELPRRKPFDMTLHKTAAGGKAPPTTPAPREPGDE